MSSSHFPPKSAVSADNPVTLPPGFARLDTRPAPSRSPAIATIGIEWVAWIGRQGAGGARGENDVWREAHQFARKGGKLLLLPRRPHELDDEIPPFHVSELTETLAQRLNNAVFERGRGVP